MNIDGTGLMNLTNNAGDDSVPIFRTDGSQIAFLSDRDGNIEIYAMNLDGTSPSNLTNDAGSDTSPDYN